uniref:Uncharacterized protein n=1 Tax=Panagrolaimus superbus TaxID=310955 RepID=A0A914Y2N6_9BILA
MLSPKNNKSSSSLETYFNTIETKPELLAKEKQFEESLKNFYRQKWPPVINGKAINLYKLYSTVLSNGGWLKVSNQDKWDEIAEEMGYSENISMINNGIKLLYMRYLSKYEEVQTLGEIDDHDTDIYGGAKSRLKMYFNFASGDCPIASFFRDKKTDTFENEYAKIVKSLYSGLPNEVDFAFNVLTVMSNPGKHLLKLEKCPFLLNLMIAHAGVYGDDKEIQSLADGWKSFCDRNFEEFWLNAGIIDEQIYGYIPVIKKESNMFESLSLSMEFDSTNPTCFRILQVTSILRNLSYESINTQSLGKSDILIKFMCVCAASKHVRLVNHALNILSNIGNEIDLITPDGMYCNVMLLKVISDCLNSDDKNKVLHSLEIISALCQNQKNEAVCAEFLDALMINRIFQLATVKDILICIHTLETLYQFSELGRACCNRIISVPNSIELLVSLLTNDAASFGRTGLSGIQVVESYGSYGHQQNARQHYPPPPSTISTSSYRPQYPAQPQPPASAYHQQTPRGVHSVQKIHHSQTSNHAVTHDEKLKNLTTKWIKDNVIAEPDTVSLRGEMYSAYVDHLRTANGIMSGTVNSFTQILQSVFPNTTVHTEQKDNKLNFYIKGVRYLNQTSSTVASNYPVMQKILATPKAVSQTVRIVPALASPTNGIIPREARIIEKSTAEETMAAPEPQLNHISNNQTKDVENTVTLNLSGKDKTIENYNGTMEVDVNDDEVFETESVMEEDLNNSIDKTEVSSEAVIQAYSPNEEEQNEISIVRVENSKVAPLIEDSTNLKPVKRINGHILENGDKSIQAEKTTNGACNGDELVDNIKENGHIAESSMIDNDAMEFDGVLSDHEEDEGKLPEGDPKKIDETVEAVSKVPLKNGKISISEVIVEEVVTNGVKGKKRKAATPKTAKKKARMAKEYVDSKNEKNGVTAINEQVASTSSTTDYMCEWNACGQLFSSSEAISIHIIKEHLTDKNEDNTFLCLWPGCNKTRRAKWSLVTHVGDHHLQENQLRTACAKRIEMGGNGLYIAAIQQQFAERINEPEIVPTYTQAAAMDAIRRHSAVHYQREFTDEQEGPVTKCIRLTTALILRNIARYSEEGRCKLRRFELQLCPLALSRLEASGALIQCLAEMDNTKSEESILSIYQPPLPPTQIQKQQQSQLKPIFAVPLPPSRQQEK